jgi:integrase
MASTANDIGTYRKIRLRQNRKGYWEVWWTDAARGYVTRRESCRSQVDTEAEAYLRAFCDAAREASAVELALREPTVEDLCVRWIDHAERVGGALKAHTGRKVLGAVRRHLGPYTAAQLAGRPLLDYSGQRGVSDGTIRRELGALRTVLLWAAKQKLVNRSELPEFELPSDGPARTKFLDQRQEARFWDQAMAWGSTVQHRNPAERRAAQDVMVFIALGLETAARRGAIHDLTWDRVDLGQGLIDYRVPGRRVVKKRRVRVPISDRLLPVLRKYGRGRPRMPAGKRSDGY